MRVFFALWPDASTRCALAAAAAALPLEHGRAVRDDNLHLTVHFLGEVDRPTLAALRDAARTVRAPAFELDIAVAGWWPASKVAWLAPREVPDGLVELIAGVRLAARASGLALAETHYQPHVTVARKLVREPAPAAAFSVAWKVREFALVASRTDPDGARYSVLEQWPLAASASDNTARSSVQ